MHHALWISEVLSDIFDYLAEDTVRHPTSCRVKCTRKDGQRALAALSRTCRAFSEPALDALWRRLHSLEPLVLCLSTKNARDDMNINWVDASPSFDEQDMSAISRHASRVRELTLEHEPLSVNVLRSLWSHTTLLLPNLRKLYWIYEGYTTLGLIRLLLSPSLAHLHVWLDSGDHSSVLGLLACYHALCPNLKSLYFGHLCRFPHVTAAVSRAIERSPNLETLACGPVDEAAWIHIAGSPRLEKITASLFNYRPGDLKRLASHGFPDRPPFENVRVLDLRVEDLSSLIPYLKADFQPFEEVSFDIRILPTSEVLYEFFSALSSLTRRRTLRRIRLFSIGTGYNICSQPVDFRVLSPLMTFSLCKFNINIGNSVSLNDDELAQFVQAWPELETFYFNQSTGWTYPWPLQIPTLRGLLNLLSRCPKLHHIGMCVDARSVPSSTEDEFTVRNTAVRELVLANSPIQQPVAGVAQFLLAHMPSLVALPGLIPSNEESSRAYRRMWKEVVVLIREANGWGSHPDSSDVY